MSASQRSKGQRGEREVAKLIADHLGFDVRRRVRQHDGDSDLEGVPGWSLEVKNHKKATRSQIEAWWYQCVSQSGDSLRPCLIYKRAPGWWRFVWDTIDTNTHTGTSYDLSVEGDVESWAAYVRELL